MVQSPPVPTIVNLGGLNEDGTAKNKTTDTGRVGPAVVDGREIPPTDYTVEVRLNTSDPTVTTLAFIGQLNENPILTELDLSLLTEAFVGLNEFVVPSLSNANLDLFVGVNLTDWLSFPTSFTFGDSFDFINGVSSDLPGILVGTSPIVLDPELGFVTANPFSGSASVVGVIDGRVVPGPGTGLLLGAGILSLLYREWRRKRVMLERTRLV
jgi:hypothetical protein